MIRYRGVTIDRKNGTISRGDSIINFRRVNTSRTFKLALALLLDRPQTVRQLVDHVYDDRGDGGPDDANNVIEVMMCQKLAPKFARVGVVIQSDQRGYSRRMYWAETT